ncbi:MAG: response regulator [Zoogloeaceae bacterium]|jgi:signal transduction histidine kinase|nr:response regulator [Zoogloeaceae bacterium]
MTDNGEILIVDDTVASLDLLAELLTQAGYEVRLAPNGHMALRSANECPPELILLDVRMPGIDGFEVCRRLKAAEKTRDIPVIFLSALNETIDKVTGFSLGAVDYIAKPYQTEEVLARVHTHIELRRLRFDLEKRVIERTEQLNQSESRLRDSHKRLRELTAFLQTVREDERATIARELHDELGQALTALRIDLGWIRNKCAGLGASVTDRITAAHELVKRTIDALHRISEGLRPGMLDVLGLAAAIEHHVDEFRERGDIECELTMNRDEFDLDNRLAITIFRVMQEATTNILRHAGASRIAIRLIETEAHICLDIEDNGCGFDASAHSNKYGLLGMQERVNMFGGEIQIDSQPGAGTRIHIKLPVQREQRS